MLGTRVWLTAPHEVVVQSFELDERLEPGMVLMEIEQTLISAGTELASVMGARTHYATGRPITYPMTLGYTAVGRLLSVGSDVTDLAPGDRVVVAAPHASHAVVQARLTLRVPDGCTSEAALLAHFASIPITGIRLARPQLGEGMVVFGQGLVGALAARFGRIAGCRPVLGVDPL